VASGVFIVLEGGEGSGKSTQSALLAARLREAGRAVVTTFEPGATERGRALRAALLDDHRPLDPRAELLLMNADRAQHVAEVLRPGLTAGAVVICDRHSPSSIVYQGVARGLGADLVASVCAIATDGLVPDAVIVLDVADRVAAARRSMSPDRIELAGDDFHERVRAAYRDLAPRHGWIVVDGNGDVDDVAGRVWDALADLIASR
jgi:dTMP kinase